MSHKITVHDFLAVGGASTSPSARRFEQGCDLALAYSSNHRWVTPQLAIDISLFTLGPKRLYRYHLDPPPAVTGRNPASIFEWGEPSHVDEPDHLRLHDLQEFESTAFQLSLTHPRTRNSHPSLHGTRPQDLDASVNERVKRRRIENTAILDLIPQPHFIPAPAVEYKPVDIARIPHYEKSLPSPIAPYDMAAVNELLRGNFRRAAWLIPVRGSLPWGGSSAAVISESSQVASRSPSPFLPVSVAQPHVISWTPDALRHLWTFLRSIQQAKHLGPLSLSFHAAPADMFSTGKTEPIWESNRPYYPLSLIERTAESFTTDVCMNQLEGTDYIKVYHDVPYSLSLRNILDAYRYEPANAEVTGRSSANDHKIRILKGARLSFMDERSNAAFVM